MLNEDDLKTFIGICGRLGSDHDGECVAAAKAATKFLANRKLTWEDVLTPSDAMMPSVVSVSTNDDRTVDESFGLAPRWVTTAKLCLANPAGLKGDREHTFLTDIIRRSPYQPTLTDKQAAWLLDICPRCGVTPQW